MAQQRMIHGRRPEADRARRQVHVEHQAVRHRRGGIPARKEHEERAVGDEGQEARDQVREDVGRLVVQVQQALEAREGVVEDGAVAREDVRVLGVPFGDPGDGEE